MLMTSTTLHVLQREDRKASYLEKIGPKPSLNGEVCEIIKTTTNKRLKDTKRPEEESCPNCSHTYTNGSQARKPGTPDSGRLDGKRCAELIAVAMANRLEEVWISKQPILLFTYLSQYFPSLFRW